MGKSTEFDYNATFDGKSSPMHGNASADSISVTGMTNREMKAPCRLHKKLTVQSVATVSADRKHLTIRRKMLTMEGEPTDVLEFDR